MTTPVMPVLWQGASQLVVLSNIFEVGGVPTDPGAISCAVTDPNGNAVTYTYNGAAPTNTVLRTGTGAYQLEVPCVTGPGTAVSGIFAYAWVGTGAASAVVPGTFTVNPVNLWQYYTTIEEMKDRLQITDTSADATLARVIRAASRRIESHCGRHFYQMSDVRTFVPYSITEQPLDDVVTITQFAVDQAGNGVFSSIWVQGTDYELAVGMYDFNLMSSGEPRPYTLARVINAAGGGQFFPFTWPFSRLDRIQVTGVFGWPQVPDAVREAAVEIASDLYKTKDAPFGIAGVAPGGGAGGFDFGTARVPKVSPVVAGLLRGYVRGQTRVGILASPRTRKGGTAMSSLYKHIPHPHLEHRRKHGPVQIADVRAGGNIVTRVNTRAAVLVTRAVGTMYAAYLFVLLALYGLPTAVKGGPSALVLWVSSEFLQLVLLPIIIVGAAVLAEVTDRLAKRQFDDVEAILHAQDQHAAHLAAQDEKILLIADLLDCGTAGGLKDILDAIAIRSGPGSDGPGG